MIAYSGLLFPALTVVGSRYRPQASSTATTTTAFVDAT